MPNRLNKLEKVYWREQAKKLAEKFTRDEIFDMYKNAKLMEDAEEVFMCREALKLVG